jgi:hypothetical protein
MNSLPQSTQRRIKKIPQTPGVWEGDRRPMENIDPDLGQQTDGECIIWIDGSEGMVRAMDMVSSQQGMEAVVRTLLRAIENPHSPAKPSRPQKIVVKDREIQFFLRGALQDLDINIDYAPQLPLIDELFRSLENSYRKKTPQIPTEYEKKLNDLALELWEDSLWDTLADCDIIAIELETPEPLTIYASILGMLGQEYGIILYRSLDSLKRFRETVLKEKSMAKLESAFLSQDCWFVNYEANDFEPEYEDEDFDLQELDAEQIQAIFGSLHPYEGMRPFLDEEESLAVYLSLEALKRFYWDHLDDLTEEIPAQMTKTYKIELPTQEKKTSKKKSTTQVKVSTLPELTSYLKQMIEELEDDEDDDERRLRVPIEDDLVPDQALIKMISSSAEAIAFFQENPKIYYHGQSLTFANEAIPAILIQTSKPKAEEMIDRLREEDGINGICFNPGENPFTEEKFSLGLIQTKEGSLYLLSEFDADDQRIREWQKLCHRHHDNLIMIVAMGITGVSKGNPQPKHILGVFEAKLLSGQDLGMGVLKAIPQLDFDPE